jgi:polyferredoxin
MWSALITSMFGAINEKSISKKRRREAEEKSLEGGPSWRYRRRLIHGAYLLGFSMVLFGAATVFMDSQIGVELIIGGVSLIAIIVTAYTTSATYEDVRVWNHNPRIRFGQNEEPMHEYDTKNPDGT